MDIVQEIEDGTVSANYIRTLNIDEPLARMKSNGTILYYQQDGLGSVIALTDETGTIKTQYNYDPFGNTELIGETSDNPFQYTGRENDGTGLYGYRFRYYSPELQRFISEDPIGFEGGINMYAYVANNPVNENDPEGLMGVRPPTPSLGDFIPPSKIPCDQTPDSYCGAEHTKKKKMCGVNPNPGCLEKARRYYAQCLTWAIGVQAGEIKCPPCK